MQKSSGSSLLAKVILAISALGAAGYILLTFIMIIIVAAIFIVAIAFIIYVFSMLFAAPISIGLLPLVL